MFDFDYSFFPPILSIVRRTSSGTANTTVLVKLESMNGDTRARTIQGQKGKTKKGSFEANSPIERHEIATQFVSQSA
ncbi:MAG: hypothetical protein COT91_01860 [Candidatus Doudnabacteria bacterium CG10_big_fil_rev_8_21_14_0_10_41_10]|uniref:Uncharacterized protein n=1 Tax=Candidatus Doudnabacteria bacterium CG10_big_fil_rev_8_21_14_0_10_41_10 TaxID=1974551 RepID=A0A2H0VE34_9BACT|nr:MAG: hypothetical protein COT91_01860 [Candidatus Doudnabacteria bacterium CG10_big_fil_rev_8_21_14_0_10_41_10]